MKLNIMNKITINSLLFVLCLFTAGCEDEKVDADHFGSLSGIIVDSETYLPLSGVLVATNPASSSLITTESGTFTFAKVPKGEISVIARKKDYLSSTVVISVYDNENTEMNMTLQQDDNDYGSVLIYDPVPGNGAVNQDNYFTMAWKVDQSNKDFQLLYDVYIFESNSTTQKIVGESLTAKEVVATGLTDNTSYYWYVVAKYDGNIIAYSPTWSFKTGSNS